MRSHVRGSPLLLYVTLDVNVLGIIGTARELRENSNSITLTKLYDEAFEIQ